MSKRSFDYKKKMNNKKKLHSKQVRKILMSSAVASTLVFQPFVPIIQNGQLIGFTENSASAATLVEVGLFENVDVAASLNNVDGTGPYNLDLSLAGSSLADIELVNPEKTALFYAPELAGSITENGPATIQAEILPITIPADSDLGVALGSITGSLTELVEFLVNGIDETINGTILAGLIEIENLDGVSAALNNLNNLNTAIDDLTAYSGQAEVVVNDNGSIEVSFGTGLNNYLETTINQLVVDTLTELLSAVDNLEINLLSIIPGASALLNSLIIDPIVEPLLASITSGANGLISDLGSGVIDLTEVLAGAQVLGNTSVALNVNIDRNVDAAGQVPVYGAVVGTNTIDVNLLGSLVDSAPVQFPEAPDTEAPAAPVVNPVGEGATEITGTAEPGSTVNVAFPGEVSGTTTAAPDGTFTVAIPDGTELVAGDQVSVTATDEAGNTSPETVVTVEDLIAPAVPVVDPVGDDATQVTGTAEANSIVEVTFPGGIVETTTAGADGTFAVNVPEEVELAAGNQITVTATDAAENESDPATVTVTDETAPDAPVFDVLDNTATEVTGTAEPGSTVTVTFPGGEAVDTTADGEGNFSVAIPGEVELAVGDTVSAVATDAANNVSTPATITVTEVDEIAPDAPIVNDVGENDTEITGTAEAGSEITVTLPGGETAEGVTDEDGNFVVTLPEGTELVAGTDLEVTATDATGNESDPTIVTVGDETAPAAPTVNEVGDNATEVTGTAEAGSEITVTLPGGETATGVADEEGNFTVTLPEGTELSAGDELTVIARDEAGNASDPTTVTVTDTTAPEAPIVDEVGDNATEITGDAEPGSNITVTLPGGETAEGVTDEAGNFSVTLPEGTELSAGDELEVIATDAAGNPSDAAIVTVVDTTAPAAPTVTPVDSTSTEVTGTAEPDSTITIILPDGTELTGEASETGEFAIDLPEDLVLEGGERLLVTATDAADNESAPRVVTVADATAPIISPIDDATVVEGLPIDPIAVEVSEESIIDPAGLPEGLTYDAGTGVITGSLSIDDWGATEEERDVTGAITAVDEAGNVSEPEEFVLTVQRDTDGDGIPDVDDTDDDNDGYTDEEEVEAGTDPKDDTDFPEDGEPDETAPVVSPIEDITAIEGEDIEDILVETDVEGSIITVDGLPTGLEFDGETNTISGAPTVGNWGLAEEERTVDVSVTAADDSGNESEAEVFAITIQRDTDGDGIPDVEDEDDDNDGYTDEEEVEAGTDPKDDTDFPDEIAPVISPLEDTSVIEGETIAPINIVIDEESNVEVTGLPEGLTYDEETESITGTPVVENWDETEEEREFIVSVGATDAAGNEAEIEEFVLTVQRDTDGDGIPDVDDTDDDNDGYTDEEEDEAGTDPKDDTDFPEEGEPDITAPVVDPIGDITAVEGEEIEDIVVETDDADSVITVEGLPNGVNFDEETNTISGAPVLEDWEAEEEERTVEVSVTAMDNSGNESETELFNITVQRDTDRDGTPDVDDNDDDNDGYTDEEEIEAGTDPKDDTDFPDVIAPIINPVGNTTAIEGFEIDPIDIVVNEESDVEVTNLPEGLAYDAESGSITGTPSVGDWDETEEEREFVVSVTATDDAGNVSAPEEFVLTVQRDTDGDGIPDVEDTDDDNDGVSDEDEIDAGTNPKDETDVPEDIEPDTTAPVITEIDDITAVEGKEIDDIEVETDDPDSVITVDGLPNGLTFDEETDIISGAPTIEDWGAEEEERTVEVVVTAMDNSGNESEAEVFAITIQRDTDGDGTPDVEDEDDDNDGFPDEEEIEAGTDPKDDTDRPDVVAPDTPLVNEVTSEDTTVDGTAEPGSEVIVTLPNGETVSGVTDEDGNFSVVLPEDLDLTGGEVLEIVARDEAGNVSDPEFVRVVDRTAPIILEIEDQRVVEGTEIENVNIVVENPGEENQDPDLAAQGFANFALRPFAAPLEGVFVQNLPEGTTFDAEENVISGIPVISDWGATEEERDLEITVIARDEAGNEATETFIITVLRDTDGDGIPDIEDEDDDNDGATDEEEIDAGTDPKDDTDVPEEADTTAPEAPTVEPVTDESTEVVGEAEPNTDVTITLPNGDTITGRTDEDGNFVIALPEDLELKVGDELTVVVTDEAGNVSAPTTVTVGDATPDEDTETPVDPEDPDNDGNTPGDGQDNGSTDGNNGNDGNGQNNGNGSSTGGNQGDDSASGNDEESLPQTGESQNVLTVISGSIMSAVGAMMLAWNKRKKGFTKRK